MPGVTTTATLAAFAAEPSPVAGVTQDEPTQAVVALVKEAASLGDGKLIGLSWRSQRPELGAAKSMRLMDWAPILRDRRAIFIDLQYGDTGAERAAHRITHSNDPGRQGRNAYTYLHLLIVAGIIVCAVAD